MLSSLIGLPPSWSASLAEAGFSEDEISAIRSRKIASRTPSSQCNYGDRPASPATMNTTPVVTRPTPRTTSLPRKFVGSNSNSSPRSSPPHPIIPPVRSSSASVSGRKPSTDSGFSNHSGSTSRDGDLPVDMADALSMLHRKQRSYSSLHSLRHIRSRTSSSVSAADFPAPQVVKAPLQPKRTLHVVNGFASLGINTPPPAYDTTDRPQFSPDRKDPTIFSQNPPESHTRNEGRA